ncbi:MAG: hypothetical protein K2X03_14430 [Bryobacteraceae bacterium]|nr:hypothetical protein [Bryobacteraceae bacterium]
MIAILFRREWREHRKRYLIYWLILNLPALLAAVAIPQSSTARRAFADLTDATVLKYFPLALAETFLLPTFFLFVTGYLAHAVFAGEAREGTFFLHEQPISRGKYAAIKLAMHNALVWIAVAFAVLFAVLVVSWLIVGSGRVSWSGASGAFTLVCGAAFRAMVWCGLISSAGFTGCALISSLSRRWWVGALGSLLFLALSIWYLGDTFDFSPAEIAPDSLSIGVDFGFGERTAPWVSVSRPLLESELQSFGQWRWPLGLALGMVSVFWWLTSLVYERREVE